MNIVERRNRLLNILVVNGGSNPFNDAGDLLDMKAASAIASSGLLIPDHGSEFLVVRDSWVSGYGDDLLPIAADAHVPMITNQNGVKAVSVEPEIDNIKSSHSQFSVITGSTQVGSGLPGPGNTTGAREYQFGANFNVGVYMTVSSTTNLDMQAEFYCVFWMKSVDSLGAIDFRFDSNTTALDYITPTTFQNSSLGVWEKFSFTIPAGSFNAAATYIYYQSRIRPRNDAAYNHNFQFWGFGLHQTTTVDKAKAILSGYSGSHPAYQQDTVITVVPHRKTAFIYEKIDGVQGPPITTIPALYKMPYGNVERVRMRETALAPSPTFKAMGPLSYSPNNTDPEAYVNIKYPSVDEGDRLFALVHTALGSISGITSWSHPSDWEEIDHLIEAQRSWILLTKIADGTETGSILVTANNGTGYYLGAKMWSFGGTLEFEAVQATSMWFGSGIDLGRTTPPATTDNTLMVAFYACTDDWDFATENKGSYTRDSYLKSDAGGGQVFASYSWSALEDDVAGTLDMATGYSDWEMGVTLQLKPIES